MTRKLNEAKRAKRQRLHDRDCPGMRDIEHRCIECGLAVSDRVHGGFGPCGAIDPRPSDGREDP